LVENTLKSLLKYDIKGRIAKIDYGDSAGATSKKALKKSDGKPNYWAIETTKPKSLHQIGAELSLRKRILSPYLGIVNAQSGLITVTEKGEIRRWNLSDLVEKDIGYPYVGVLPPERQQLIISLNNGLWGNYHMEQKATAWTTKLIHSGADKVLCATSLDKGDILWTFSETYLESVACDWEPFSRANKTGWKLRGHKNIRLLSIPKGCSLTLAEDSPFDGNLSISRYPFSDLIRPTKNLISKFLTAKFYYLYNPNDDKRILLCIAQDGTRSLMTGKEVNSSSADLIQTYLI